MYTFSKSERLCNKTLIQNLYSNGKSISEEFIRLVYLESNQTQKYLKSQIVVPKKIVSRAVDRNHIKRQIKESIRKNKFLLIDFFKENKIYMNCAVIYQSRNKYPSYIVEEKIIVLFKRLISKLWKRFFLWFFFQLYTYIKI